MRRLLFLLSAALLAAAPIFGELPEFYKSVAGLVWVVDDLDQATQGWRKLGFSIQELDISEPLAVTFRGKPAEANVRVASGRFGDVPAYWIQPLGGTNAYAEFLKKHGSGVFSLLHRVPTAEAFEVELKRLRGLGVGVLQEGAFDSDSGTTRYAFLDTESEGKYILGLLHVPGSIEDSPLAVQKDLSGRKVAQYAFAVRDLEAVSRFWAKLGFPEMSYTHPNMSELRYRGEPGRFDMRLGWQRHGHVVYEWIQSLKGPNVYLDHMAKHGEGIHHLAFQVEDMDKEIAGWTAKGFPVAMSGAWGEKNKPGSGRFAYQDTSAIGGVDVELLWSFK